MNDPGLTELEKALRQYCDEVLSDLTVSTAAGAMRRVHWRYREHEFRATILLLQPDRQFTLGEYRDWRTRGQEFARLPSAPVFEALGDSPEWEAVLNVNMWRWALRTAGRHDRDRGDDESPGDLAGRPVRPRPGLPSLSASAAAIPPREADESRHFEQQPLASRVTRETRHGLPR